MEFPTAAISEHLVASCVLMRLSQLRHVGIFVNVYICNLEKQRLWIFLKAFVEFKELLFYDEQFANV